jgi:uncharacterized protein DUF748
VSEAPPRKKRRWLRRILVALLLVVLAVRIGGQMALPKVASALAAKAGLAIAWERLDLSLLGGSFELYEVDLRRRDAPAADGEAPLLHLDALQFDLDVLALCKGRVRVHRVALDGLDAEITRRADGCLAIDGWACPSLPASPATADPALPVATASSAAPAAAPPSPYCFDLPVEIDQFRVQNIRVHLRDEAVRPALESRVALDLRVSDLGGPLRPPRVEMLLRAPGVVRSLEIKANGKTSSCAVDGRIEVAVHGLSAALLQRYLPDAPIAASAKEFDLELEADGSLAATDPSALALAGHVAVDRLVWRADGNDELAAKARVDLKSLSAHAAEVALASVDVKGHAARLKSGELRLGGLDLLPAKESAPEKKEEPSPPFVVRVDELRPSVSFAFRDERRSPPREVDFALHDTSVKNLSLDPAHADVPIEVDLHAEAAGAKLALAGSVQPFSEKRQGALALKVGGLAALCKELGLDCDWSDGSLELEVDTHVTARPDRLDAGVALKSLRLTDGGRQLAALDRLNVPTVTKTPAGLSIDRVELVKPAVAIVRAQDGSVRIAGLCFGAPPAGGPRAAQAAGPPESPAVAPPPDAPAPAAAAPPARPAVSIGAVTIDGTAIRWSDQKATPPREATVGVDVKVGAVDLAAATPIPFEVLVRIEKALDELKVAGTATPDPDHLATELDLSASGLRREGLAGYLPPEQIAEEGGGRLALHLAAALERAADGRRSAHVALTKLEARNRAAGPPLVALERFSAVAPQVDLAAGPIELSELAIEGLQVAVPRPGAGAEGKVEPLQVALAFHQRGAWSVWSKDPDTLPPLAFDLGVSAEGLAREIHLGVSASPFAARPAVEVDLAVRGLTGGGLALVDSSMRGRVDASAFAEGSLTAKLAVELDFKRRNPADFDLRDGFGGTVRLSDVELRATPDGEPVAGLKSLEMEIAAIRPRSGDVNLRSLDLRGPSANVRRTAEGIEIGGILLRNAPPPSAAAEPPTKPPSEPGKPGEPGEPAAPPATTVIQPPASRLAELRVDALTVSGVECTFTDETASPPLIVPVKDLELEVRRFTTRALTEARPVQFRLDVAGGPIELAKRDTRSLIGGALSSAAGAIVGKGHELGFEKRPACESIEVIGQTTLVQPLNGWARIDVRALELQALRSLAKSGVEIHDGVVDSSVDARMRGADGISVDSKTTFSWLSLKEPPNGPISSYLRLPAPLDTVLFLLRDKDGQQQVPLRFDLAADGLSKAEITRVATETLLRLIRDAIASAPMRIVSGALDAVQLSQIPGFDKLPGLSDIPGLGRLFGKSEPKAEAPPLVLELAPGATRLPDDARRRLQPLFDSLRDDEKLRVTIEHQLGSADQERLQKLARPRQGDLAALGSRLRRRRDELAARHDALSAEARGAFAMGRAPAAATTTQDLRAVDRELAVVEQAIDQVYALHGEIAPRDDDRLVRRACVMYAELRLADLRDLLDAQGIGDLSTRIDVRPVRATPAPELVNSRIVIRTRAQ